MPVGVWGFFRRARLVFKRRMFLNPREKHVEGEQQTTLIGFTGFMQGDGPCLHAVVERDHSGTVFCHQPNEERAKEEETHHPALRVSLGVPHNIHGG